MVRASTLKCTRQGAPGPHGAGKPPAGSREAEERPRQPTLPERPGRSGTAAKRGAHRTGGPRRRADRPPEGRRNNRPPKGCAPRAGGRPNAEQTTRTAQTDPPPAGRGAKAHRLPAQDGAGKRARGQTERGRRARPRARAGCSSFHGPQVRKLELPFSKLCHSTLARQVLKIHSGVTYTANEDSEIRICKIRKSEYSGIRTLGC